MKKKMIIVYNHLRFKVDIRSFINNDLVLATYRDKLCRKHEVLKHSYYGSALRKEIMKRCLNAKS